MKLKFLFPVVSLAFFVACQELPRNDANLPYLVETDTEFFELKQTTAQTGQGTSSGENMREYKNWKLDDILQGIYAPQQVVMEDVPFMGEFYLKVNGKKGDYKMLAEKHLQQALPIRIEEEERPVEYVYIDIPDATEIISRTLDSQEKGSSTTKTNRIFKCTNCNFLQLIMPLQEAYRKPIRFTEAAQEAIQGRKFDAEFGVKDYETKAYLESEFGIVITEKEVLEPVKVVRYAVSD